MTNGEFVLNGKVTTHGTLKSLTIIKEFHSMPAKKSTPYIPAKFFWKNFSSP